MDRVGLRWIVIKLILKRMEVDWEWLDWVGLRWVEIELTSE